MNSLQIDEYELFHMFFKTPKEYMKPKEIMKKTDVESLRLEEVKDQDMFDSDDVVKCDDIDAFICGICLMLAKKPFVCRAQCSAILCQKCLETNKDDRGPICRAEEGFTLSLSQSMVQDESVALKCRYTDGEAEIKMSEFTTHLMKCPHAPYRCVNFPHGKVIIKRRDVHMHKTVCDYTKVRCRYFHSHLGYRKDLQSHEEKNCEYKTMTCKGGKATTYKRDFHDHITACQEYPLICVNCNISIRRADFGSHPDECPKAMVKCLAYEQCSYETTRDTLEKHQRECSFVYDYHKKMIYELKENLIAKNELIKSLTTQLNQKSSKGFSLSNLFSKY